MDGAWATLFTFSQNHKQLRGSPGAVAVLHTHSRRLEFHPHVHLAMPAAALDADQGLWRSLRKSTKGGGYLFNHNALAKVRIRRPATPVSCVARCSRGLAKLAALKQRQP